jgi:hypothetical protein
MGSLRGLALTKETDTRSPGEYVAFTSWSQGHACVAWGSGSLERGDGCARTQLCIPAQGAERLGVRLGAPAHNVVGACVVGAWGAGHPRDAGGGGSGETACATATNRQHVTKVLEQGRRVDDHARQQRPLLVHEVCTEQDPAVGCHACAHARQTRQMWWLLTMQGAGASAGARVRVCLCVCVCVGHLWHALGGDGPAGYGVLVTRAEARLWYRFT